MSLDRRTFLLALASLPAWRAEAASVDGSTQFAPVLPGYRLDFPRDHGAHPAFRTEWWYITGWLARPAGRPLGFQSTFFRIRSGIGERNPSRFAPSQLLVAHAAIADPDLGRLRHDQRMARAGTGVASYATGRTALRIGSWHLDDDGADAGSYRTEVRSGDFAYALVLTTGAPPMRNGLDGFSAKAGNPVHASYYYSRPQLDVTGTVTLDGRQQAVTGKAWLDHEWSSELLPAEAQGWDWIGLNLDDGGALMAFRLRRGDGQALWAAATWRPPHATNDDSANESGRTQTFAPEAVEFIAGRHWRSPRTGIRYPVEWRVRVGQRSLDLAPLLDDQELDSRNTTAAVYWEGAVRAFENGREIGRGYLELTGYGDRIRFG